MLRSTLGIALADTIHEARKVQKLLQERPSSPILLASGLLCRNMRKGLTEYRDYSDVIIHLSDT